MDEKTNEEMTPTPIIQPLPPRRPMGKRILTWVTLIAVLFALGFFTTYFLLYVPLQTRANDLTLKAQELESTKAQLSTTETQLADTQTKLDSAANAVKRLEQQTSLLKVQHALVTARLALMEQDTLTATQAVDLAQTDLDDLLADLNEPETVKALQDRMTKVRTALGSKEVNAAMAELRIMDENLSFLYERISK